MHVARSTDTYSRNAWGSGGIGTMVGGTQLLQAAFLSATGEPAPGSQEGLYAHAVSLQSSRVYEVGVWGITIRPSHTAIPAPIKTRTL
jgi:hypothetical protein